MTIKKTKLKNENEIFQLLIYVIYKQKFFTQQYLLIKRLIIEFSTIRKRLFMLKETDQSIKIRAMFHDLFQ